MEFNEVISLLDEDGHRHDFTLVDVIECDQRRYAVLSPVELGEDEDRGAAVVFRVEEDTLVAIDDEVEFDRVVQALEDTGTYDDVTRVNGGGDEPHPGV